jgi:uncharacterized protein (DUF2267 family)
MALPTNPDPHRDADFKRLVEALAREGLPRRAEAARAVEAVVCALSQRIGAAEYDELREHLPEPFRGQLAACERHAISPRPQPRSPSEFYEIVAEDLDRDPEEVESVVRAVFAAMRAQIDEGAAELVSAQLPPDLEPLWRRVS